jgi:uracil-DNA glycosylase
MDQTRRQLRLDELAEHIRHCVQCPLHTSRTHAVPGRGNPTANVMLIGEAPGREEDERGQPFVGAAGRFLDRMLAEHGLDRQTFFITNIVKCRPPKNRTPRKGEIDTCVPLYLIEQIALIDPVVIMLLGGVAAKQFLGIKRINEARGRVIEHDQRHYIVGYHPAASFYRDDIAAKIQEDFAVLARAVRELKPA